MKQKWRYQHGSNRIESWNTGFGRGRNVSSAEGDGKTTQIVGAYRDGSVNVISNNKEKENKMKITNEQIGTIGTILCGLITLGISIWKMNNPAAEQTSETQKGE